MRQRMGSEQKGKGLATLPSAQAGGWEESWALMREPGGEDLACHMAGMEVLKDTVRNLKKRVV